MAGSKFASPMTHDSAHPLETGTLALWLGVAAVGAAGFPLHPATRPALRDDRIGNSIWVTDVGPMGGGTESSANLSESASDPALDEIDPTPIPVPPEMPVSAETEPLPEIPSFPSKPAAASGRNTQRSATSSARTGGSTGQSRSPSGTASRGGGGSGGGMSASSRLAAGRMTAPVYPPFSRRNNQSGTVVVEFTIGANGRVVAAHAKKPCPYPLLNNAAVNAVRTWRFPPGTVMTLQRPIVFQLR